MWYAHRFFISSRCVYDQLSAGAPTDVFVLGGGEAKGTADKFYAQKQLLPEPFATAAEGKGKVNLRMQEGYDHSYYFVASFADDHVNHAAKYLHH